MIHFWWWLSDKIELNKHDVAANQKYRCWIKKFGFVVIECYHLIVFLQMFRTIRITPILYFFYHNLL